MHSHRYLTAPLLALILLLYFAACTSEKTADRNGSVALTLDTIVVDTAAGDCATDSAAPCARIHLSYPVITRGLPDRIRDSINSIITAMVAPGMTGEGEESVHRAVEFFLSSFDQTLNEFDDFNQGWEHEGTVTITFVNRRMISLRADEFSYTGGAHPNSTTRMIMLSLSNGLRLTIRDLLTSGWEQDIDSLARTAFRELQHVPDSLSIAEAGFWGFEDGFVLPENLCVDSSGVLLHYNAYEVGPYSAGPTEFTIPFERIQSLIDPSGPLGD